MKELYLLRHAKSSRDYPELTDFERPINSRGRHDIPIMADVLKKREITPDLIVSSPTNRTLTTARFTAEAIDYPLKDIQVTEEIYEAWVEDIVKVLTRIDNAFDKVLLVGHNPGLQLLGEWLDKFEEDNLPTCGLIGYSLKIDSWEELEKGCGRFLFFEYPKKYS